MKFRRSAGKWLPRKVAPFTGAWIEISAWPAAASVTAWVAPFTGAWIEMTIGVAEQAYKVGSHPSRVRGLKSLWRSTGKSAATVAPFTGAWIEISV